MKYGIPNIIKTCTYKRGETIITTVVNGDQGRIQHLTRLVEIEVTR